MYAIVRAAMAIVVGRIPPVTLWVFAHHDAAGAAALPSNEAQPVPWGPVVILIVGARELLTVQSRLMVLICLLLLMFMMIFMMVMMMIMIMIAAKEPTSEGAS